MEAALIALAWLACALHVIAFVRIWWFIPIAVKSEGIGRISLLSWASLKAWVVVFLLLTLILAPAIARGYLRREIVPFLNLALILYLLIQPLAVNVAISRWDRKRKRELRADLEAENAGRL